ncbi:MAG TPA: helix-turn-helix transcriptional regulator [Acidimicrobiales bacterium]
MAVSTAPAKAPSAPPRRVGELLREWRRRRRLSQLDLAVEAEVSARHLSFVETGRASPSRELVLHLAEHLDVPLRERNRLLLAAGYAPVYAETPLEADAMAPVRAALDRLLAGHEPNPAVVVDQRWDLVAANATAQALMTEGVAPHLLRPPINTARVSLHPEGLAPRIVNLAEYGAHLVTRLQRQAALAGDAALADLSEELRSYPGVGEPAAVPEDVDLLFVPLRLRVDGGELRFFSTIATFGTALDVTLAELAIEQFFPADEGTAERLRAAASARH